MVRIGTHNGAFHCDEALGCYLLRKTSDFEDAEIVRSRDPEVLKDLDVVIDVGGAYDPDKKRFDHHQKGFDEVFGFGFKTKLSSAGLVYKHYGEEIVASLLGLPASHPDVRKVFLKVYESFVEGLDGIDNGVDQYVSAEAPRYKESTNLSSRVARLNPRWNEPKSEEVETERFLRASELAGSEFCEAVDYYGRCWLPARSVVEAAIAKRKEVDPSGEIVVFEKPCPWKEHLYAIEEELGLDVPIKFCIYSPREADWRVQAVSVQPSSFENRKSLPWRGLRDSDLSEASGIEGCVFVHANGFVGGNKTYEGALAMARKALVVD
eukprot:CAMPEP_0177610364 /NCGR_PEP_ID=MMETSP0419_2-20121207/19723_1 /TAXON_ID=582737 /ORGANISM="Tetraselmis sp., Strain GSL018" /LENGTH=321 /DNA_ID=CAMNT_0019105631 /DNA_START=117 /DNA_END=1082 /DNA_ORIENTATION=+